MARVVVKDCLHVDVASDAFGNLLSFCYARFDFFTFGDECVNHRQVVLRRLLSCWSWRALVCT